MTTPGGSWGLTRAVGYEVLHLSGRAQATIALCCAIIIVGMTVIGSGSILGMGSMMALLGARGERADNRVEVRSAQRELIVVAILCEVVSAGIGGVIIILEPAGAMEGLNAAATAVVSAVLWSTCFFAVRGIATRWTLELSYRLAMGMEGRAARYRARTRAEKAGERARIATALALWAACWPSFLWMLSAMAGAERELRVCASAAGTGIGIGLVLALACRESDSVKVRQTTRLEGEQTG